VGAVGDVIRRMGIVGDVHTESTLLELALAHLKAQQVDVIVCTGDVPDGPEGARGADRACRMLREAGVLTVSGNHERWMQEGEQRNLPDAVLQEDLDRESLEYLAGLPPVRELPTALGPLLLCHGLGHDDMAKVGRHDRGHTLSSNQGLQDLLALKRYRFVVNGHSHQPMVRNLEGLSIVNGGTLLRAHNPGCVLADFENHEVVFWEFGADKALVETGRFELG